jgi:hypothetical protein
MQLMRLLFLLLLLASGTCFVLFAVTSRPHFKRWGWVVLKWTLVAAFGFFAVLIAERLA